MEHCVRRRRRLLVSASFGVLALGPAAAMAQEVQTSQVEDVIVTAQRRDQNLQDVPVTLTVLGGEEIEEARIQAVQDVVQRTPGLQFDAYPSSEPRISVRGVASSDRGAGGDPSSAVFVDEIYYGRPAAITFDSFDLARIEVLKGPQGTLFGRNVVGGAVNIVTNRPDLTGFDARAEAVLGAYDTRELAGLVNIPLGDGTAALRVSAGVRQRDGYVDRVQDGEVVGVVDARDSQTARAQLRIEPSNGLRVNLTADYARDRDSGPSIRAIADDGEGGLSGLYVLNTDPDYTFASFDGQQDRDTWGLRARIEYDLSFATLSYLGAYRELDYFAFYDFSASETPDGLPPGIGLITGGTDEDSTIASHELQLRSSPDSVASWVVGLYRYQGDTTRTALSFLDLEALLGAVVDEIITQDNETTSTAVYGDITYPLTDRLNVFGGARYTQDEKTNVATGESNAPGTFNVNDEYENIRAENDWDAVTWRVGADYDLAEDVMVYGSVSRGFKSGGYQESPGDGVEAAEPYNPEYMTNYELGLRSQFMDGQVTFNASIYQSDYTDLQVRVPSGTGVKTSNAGAAKIRGLETEAIWRVGGGFDISATYAYTRARFTDYVTIEAGDPVDYTGNRLTRTPEHKFTVSPSYSWGLASGAELRVAADFVYESTIFDDASNRPPEIREPTQFLDARVIYTSADDQWSVMAWGKNLTDEVTKTYEGTFGGVTFGAFNPPPTYGVTLRVNY